MMTYWALKEKINLKMNESTKVFSFFICSSFFYLLENKIKKGHVFRVDLEILYDVINFLYSSYH